MLIEASATPFSAGRLSVREMKPMLAGSEVSAFCDRQ
jgi:hypothetical protein